MPFTPTHILTVPGSTSIAVMERTDTLGFRSFLTATEYAKGVASEWFIHPTKGLMQVGMLAPAGTVLTRLASYL